MANGVSHEGSAAGPAPGGGGIPALGPASRPTAPGLRASALSRVVRKSAGIATSGEKRNRGHSPFSESDVSTGGESEAPVPALFLPRLPLTPIAEEDAGWGSRRAAKLKEEHLASSSPTRKTPTLRSRKRRDRPLHRWNHHPARGPAGMNWLPAAGPLPASSWLSSLRVHRAQVVDGPQVAQHPSRLGGARFPYQKRLCGHPTAPPNSP